VGTSLLIILKKSLSDTRKKYHFVHYSIETYHCYMISLYKTVSLIVSQNVWLIMKP